MPDLSYTPAPALVELVATAVAETRTDCEPLEPCEGCRASARRSLSALATEGRLLPGPLLAVHTNDGRVYHPSDVRFAVGPWLPVPDTTDKITEE